MDDNNNIDLNEMGRMLTLLINNQPVEDFLGYSSDEMEDILYNPFNADSMVRLKKDIPKEVLDQIPLLRIAEYMLEKIDEAGELKLTKTGKLPVKVVFGIYGKHFTEEMAKYSFYKPTKEQDILSVHITRVILEMSRLVKKRNNKLSLTAVGKNLIKDRNKVLDEIFRTYTLKLNQGYLDGYNTRGYGNIGIAFILIILSTFGDEVRLGEFYAEKYHKAFPELLEGYVPSYSFAEDELKNCFNLRIIQNFFRLFNLAEVESYYKNYKEVVRLKKSDIFNKMVYVAPSNAGGNLN